MNRRGDWMQTFTGRAFWPLDPRVQDVCIEDIAHALACQNRYAGHTREPYSVGEHSVRVACAVDVESCQTEDQRRRLQLAGLPHDAAEAYLVDLPRPVKLYMPEYKVIELRLQHIIEEWADLDDGALEDFPVKYADEVLLATEKRDLLGPPPSPWTLRATPLPAKIEPWSWQRAEREFLTLFAALQGAAT